MKKAGPAWIAMIGDQDASPALTGQLEAARAPSGHVDNVMRIHSLRPHTMAGHRALYMSVLHDPGNSLPLWFQEVIASYVSILNRCDYSLTNHFANARHLIGDDPKADRILAALKAREPAVCFAGAELAMLQYAGKLTLAPGDMVPDDVADLQRLGIDDGEILEVNQICGYFNYVNRLLNGLGVTLAGDVVGYYVSPEEADSKRVASEDAVS